MRARWPSSLSLDHLRHQDPEILVFFTSCCSTSTNFRIVGTLGIVFSSGRRSPFGRQVQPADENQSAQCGRGGQFPDPEKLPARPLLYHTDQAFGRVRHRSYLWFKTSELTAKSTKQMLVPIHILRIDAR